MFPVSQTLSYKAPILFYVRKESCAIYRWSFIIISGLLPTSTSIDDSGKHTFNDFPKFTPFYTFNSHNLSQETHTYLFPNRSPHVMIDAIFIQVEILLFGSLVYLQKLKILTVLVYVCFLGRSTKRL